MYRFNLLVIINLLIYSSFSVAWDRGLFDSFQTMNKVKIDTATSKETLVLEGITSNNKIPKEFKRFKGKVVLYRKTKNGYQVKINGNEDLSIKLLEWGYSDLNSKTDSEFIEEYAKARDLAKIRKTGIWSEKRIKHAK